MGFRDEIDGLASGLFEPVWTSEIFTPALMSREIAARTSAPYLITTCMDSDDAFAKPFVSALQGEFESQDLMFIDFPLGCQLDRSGAIY